MLFTKKNLISEKLKIPFVAISFKSNLRFTGLLSVLLNTLNLSQVRLSSTISTTKEMEIGTLLLCI